MNTTLIEDLEILKYLIEDFEDNVNSISGLVPVIDKLINKYKAYEENKL